MASHRTHWPTCCEVDGKRPEPASPMHAWYSPYMLGTPHTCLVLPMHAWDSPRAVLCLVPLRIGVALIGACNPIVAESFRSSLDSISSSRLPKPPRPGARPRPTPRRVFWTCA